jgi:hypothetical protein
MLAFLPLCAGLDYPSLNDRGQLRRTIPRHKAPLKACSEQATARRMGGRERLRPNRDFPATHRTTREPPQTNRCKCSAQKTLAEPRHRIPNHHEPMVPFTTAGRLRGLMRFPRSAEKPRFGRSLSLPHIRRAAACSGQDIFSGVLSDGSTIVLVIVLAPTPIGNLVKNALSTERSLLSH